MNFSMRIVNHHPRKAASASPLSTLRREGSGRVTVTGSYRSDLQRYRSAEGLDHSIEQRFSESFGVSMSLVAMFRSYSAFNSAPLLVANFKASEYVFPASQETLRHGYCVRHIIVFAVSETFLQRLQHLGSLKLASFGPCQATICCERRVVRW